MEFRWNHFHSEVLRRGSGAVNAVNRCQSWRCVRGLLKSQLLAGRVEIWQMSCQSYQQELQLLFPAHVGGCRPTAGQAGSSSRPGSSASGDQGMELEPGALLVSVHCNASRLEL